MMPMSANIGSPLHLTTNSSGVIGMAAPKLPPLFGGLIPFAGRIAKIARTGVTPRLRG
jgi:hypothetical protein